MMVNSKNETQNRSHIVKSLMQAQEKGLLSGIKGRLGDLGSIPEQYDVAISTACP